MNISELQRNLLVPKNAQILSIAHDLPFSCHPVFYRYRMMRFFIWSVVSSYTDMAGHCTSETPRSILLVFYPTYSNSTLIFLDQLKLALLDTLLEVTGVQVKTSVKMETLMSEYLLTDSPGS